MPKNSENQFFFYSLTILTIFSFLGCVKCAIFLFYELRKYSECITLYLFFLGGGNSGLFIASSLLGRSIFYFTTSQSRMNQSLSEWSVFVLESCFLYQFVSVFCISGLIFDTSGSIFLEYSPTMSESAFLLSEIALYS